MKFRKKNVTPLIWLAAAILFVYHDASRPTPMAFMRQAGAYALGAFAFVAVLAALTLALSGLKALYRTLRSAPTPSEDESLS